MVMAFIIGEALILKLSSPPPLLICTTLRAFVEQQQYFFDMLWKKAIPAKQRIKGN